MPFVAQAISLILAVGLLIFGFMASVVLVPIALIAILGIGGWLWWKTRALRRVMREAQRQQRAAEDEIIEGEFKRESTENRPGADQPKLR